MDVKITSSQTGGFTSAPFLLRRRSRFVQSPAGLRRNPQNLAPSTTASRKPHPSMQVPLKLASVRSALPGSGIFERSRYRSEVLRRLLSITDFVETRDGRFLSGTVSVLNWALTVDNTANLTPAFNQKRTPVESPTRAQTGHVPI